MAVIPEGVVVARVFGSDGKRIGVRADVDLRLVEALFAPGALDGVDP